MTEKDIMTEAEEWHRHQSTMLSAFEEIALTFLNSVSGESGNKEVFASLQDYLDGTILINGAYSRRRTVLLAIHDMNEEQEAPLALQDKTLEQLEFLGLRPVPVVRFYQDVATAILRMEVVIRLKATQTPGEAPVQPATVASGLWPEESEDLWKPEPVEPQAGNVKRMPWEEWELGPDTLPKSPPRQLSNLAITGAGIAAAACLAGAFVMFGSLPQIRFHPVHDLSASTGTAAPAQERARNCALTPASDEGKDISASECAASQIPDDTQPELPAPATASGAPENAVSSVASAAVPGVTAPSRPAIAPQEPPSQPAPWAVSVEAASAVASR